MVSKFRIFETFDTFDTRGDVADYLSLYNNEPLTKNEMIDNIAMHALKEFDVTKLFRVKKFGKDRDPMFFTFGKIHGLENIAFADPQEVKETNGNPVKIQQIVDRYDSSPILIDSYEHLISELQATLKSYREQVDKIPMNPSDRKKILALPFYLAKR